VVTTDVVPQFAESAKHLQAAKTAESCGKCIYMSVVADMMFDLSNSAERHEE
jgi:hypothetical protein